MTTCAYELVQTEVWQAWQPVIGVCWAAAEHRWPLNPIQDTVKGIAHVENTTGTCNM